MFSHQSLVFIKPDSSSIDDKDVRLPLKRRAAGVRGLHGWRPIYHLITPITGRHAAQWLMLRRLHSSDFILVKETRIGVVNTGAQHAKPWRWSQTAAPWGEVRRRRWWRGPQLVEGEGKKSIFTVTKRRRCRCVFVKITAGRKLMITEKHLVEKTSLRRDTGWCYLYRQKHIRRLEKKKKS